MPEFKRVRLDNGAEVSVGFVSDDMTVLDEPALRADGRVLPSVMPKPKTTVARASAKKKAKTGGGSATSEEDSQ